MKTENAILFLVFNRPEETQLSFARIREAQPPRLYVAADGPRTARPDEAKTCMQVRAIATQVDWPCEVKTLFRDENLGCGKAVSSGISWFFENEEQGIILEDDILPAPEFFPFCDALLEKYKDHEDVGLISGYCPAPDLMPDDSDYQFWRYAHIWGWASWRRAWKHYDHKMTAWPNGNGARALKQTPGANAAFVANWERTLHRTYIGEIDTWDYQLFFALRAHQMLSIIPRTNLVENIGFNERGTHITSADGISMEIDAANPLQFPLAHPTSKNLNITLNRKIGRDHYNERYSQLPRLYRKRLKRYLKNIGRRR